MTIIQPGPNLRRRQIPRTGGRRYQSIFIMSLITLFLLGGIGSRLAYLQLVQGQENREKAENNRVRLLPKPPIRGTIFDRKGDVLVTSRLSHSVFIWPLASQKPYWDTTVKTLSDVLGIPEAEIRQKVEQAGYDSPTLVRIQRGLNKAQITAFEELEPQLKGASLDIDPVRHYPHKELGSHILGYTGELNAEELKESKREGYIMGDVVGKMGVEAGLEPLLRGEWGGQQVEVNGAGKVMRVLGEKEAEAGGDVTLTIDLDLQKTAGAALGNRKGAIVALDPRNGEVLAMVSNPGFDPNIFSTRVTPDVWKELQGRDHPFVNRALRGFPPASTFKIVTAVAGMETGKFSPDTVLPTYAYLRVGGTSFGEWNRAGFGPMGFVKALAWSSNTFFGQIGKGVGGPALIDWSRRFGFGSATGIELPGEAAGLIADNEWKKDNFDGWEWHVGDTVNMSIGQGFTQATPLQVAVMFAVPANSGYKVTPHLLKNNGKPDEEWRKSLDLDPETVKTVREGLREVVSSGTGRAAQSEGMPPVAGKSGTAEAPPGEAHAWFGAFAPYDKPEIVVVAFAEHSGGGGGSVAAPMVNQVLRTYFKVKDKKEKESK